MSAALVSAYPDLDDSWRQSAAIGVAAQAPDRFLADALASSSPDRLRNFVGALCSQINAKANSSQLVSVIAALANGSKTASSLVQVALESLANRPNSAPVPNWNVELKGALQKLLSSSDPGVVSATLPLIARWDKQATLKDEIKGIVATLTTKLSDSTLTDGERARVVNSVLPLRGLNAEILPAIGKLLGPPSSPELQRRVIEALGGTADPSIGQALAGAYTRLDPGVRNTALAQILKRSDWSLAFLDTVQSGVVNASDIGLADFYRLRSSPDMTVASRANDLWNKARGGAALEKNALIAKFTPAVTQPGDVRKGKEVFTANCATCHKLDDLGNEVGPILTGMGAHGPAELLVHILDPNREVDPSYISYNIETKDGEIYDGIVVRDNPARVVIRNASGEKEISTTQIESRRSSGRSLMPEGFEALGGENLRDLLAFVCAGESRYRFIDLSSAFTADSRRGIYSRPEALDDTFKFPKFGVVTVGSVPFNLVDPAKAVGGKNLVVLKGGASGSFARTLAKRVETKVGFAVSKLHFLGGVAGWGFPGGGEGTPVMKATAHFSDGQSEEFLMKNGDEFADWIRVVDVPGSKLTEGIVSANQLRWFSKTPNHRGILEKLVLESFDNGVAPTTVAITAELPDDAGAPGPVRTASAAPEQTPAASPAAAAPFQWGTGTRVLLVGGGSSHDFNKWFNRADSATLQEGGRFAVNYTESSEVAARELPHVEVAILSVNRTGFPTEPFRKALLDFVNEGKGLVLLHPGVWYNWPEWPDYNRTLAGGGSRGHDRIAEFEVKVTGKHPLTKDLPATFRITDELYWFDADPKGSRIQVLATTHSPSRNKDYPMIWYVEHPKARIAGIALGHDARAHDLPEFKQLLKNATSWAAGRD